MAEEQAHAQVRMDDTTVSIPIIEENEDAPPLKKAKIVVDDIDHVNKKHHEINKAISASDMNVNQGKSKTLSELVTGNDVQVTSEVTMDNLNDRNTLEMMPIGGKLHLFHCNYCQKDITRNLRIKCAECQDFDLCIECFSVGVEVSGHLKTHAYRVADCLAFSVFVEDWTAEEELLLIEGIETFGLGNWRDVADHVSSKSDKRCEQHYTEYFLKDENTEGVVSIPMDISTTSLSSASETWTANNLCRENLPGSDIAGYMPLRGDFDVEHDNDAELVLADMEFYEDDHPTERELKLRVVDIYNSKLDERERRKKFVIERDLLNYKKQQQLERKLPKEEREVIAQMRPFARFHTKEEHDEFVGGLLTAMRLRKRITQLQQYRRLGIRTFAEADEYEAEKKKRETQEALQKQRESVSYLYDSGQHSSTSGGRGRSSRWLSRNKPSSADTPDETARQPNENEALQPTLDISKAPGVELLSPKEEELCSKLELLPKHYMAIKDALIRECFRVGYLSEITAKQMIKIDIKKTGKIYDFFIHSGWISSDRGTLTDDNIELGLQPGSTKSPISTNNVTVAKNVDLQPQPIDCGTNQGEQEDGVDRMVLKATDGQDDARADNKKAKTDSLPL